MEIGSFIGLDLKDTGEYFQQKKNIARLNSARAGIYHACQVLGCSSVYIPYYLCPTVKIFLLKNGINVKSYFINEKYEPLNIQAIKNHAILLVNYFGILSMRYMKILADRFENVIIDNSAAFYSNPVKDCYNVYSPRKFFGVPDGCYVIGNNAEKFTDCYEQDFSSDTASFLLKRIELGTSATYAERMKNEERIDNAAILNMSALSKALLKNIDYKAIRDKRKENFQIAQSLYKKQNCIDPTQFMDTKCIPMVYPLVIENAEITEILRNRKIYVGRLWNQVLREVPETVFEAKLSKYLIPIPIDQRYGKKDLLYVYHTILKK